MCRFLARIVCQGDSGSSLVVNRAGVLFSAGVVFWCDALLQFLFHEAARLHGLLTWSVDSWPRRLTGQTTRSSSSSHSPTIRLSGYPAAILTLLRLLPTAATGIAKRSSVDYRNGRDADRREKVCSPSGRSAFVSWTRPWLSGGDSSYTYRATASPGGRSCTTTIGTSCIITGLDPLTTYSVSVTASNRAGRGPAGSATFTTSDSIVRSADEIGVDCTGALSHRFTDIAASHWAYGPVGCIYNLGVTKGTGPTSYSPKGLVTREQMAAFLARLFAALTGSECAGTHPFTDIAVSHWAYGPVGCIYNLRITKGTGPTTYSPGEFVTREQMAAFLARIYTSLT